MTTKNPRGRPPIGGNVVKARLCDEDYAAFAARCEALGRDMAVVLRGAIETWMRSTAMVVRAKRRNTEKESVG